ncbi:glycoside hydrolase family 13 protein [Microlunatus parietis]|uniref:Oligo-1,6-glucosidase n=1 Tax=Microlunatus parietis TaxID=682979 RepID=A0A7Y9LBE3_9ACTN|nr:alpha-glucosidase [Microlunatus parietis]NYE71642.1 oligo-1,6-glucosidase [Microlunatus parietis]
MTSAAGQEWWRSAVVYQVYPRSFADSNGDGIGDLPGLVGRLDYLHRLGVDVVWLSPVFASPQDDNGYDISDYYAIDPVFGTLDDLDRLIDGLHRRGMKLMLDMVVNHTSDEHPWFVEARDPASPKRDWYWWRPPAADGGPPYNWASVFSGSAWTLDERSGEYYLHLYGAKQPDLNWENPEVRQAMQAMMRWWADRGVDGFRLDAINLIAKADEFADGPPMPGSPYGIPWDLVAYGPRLDQFLAELHREVGFTERKLITVGETAGVTIEQARRLTDPARGELGMVFTFDHLDLDQKAVGAKWGLADVELPVLKRAFARWQDGLADVGWNSLYWNNHDQPRVVSRFGDDSAEHRVASAKTLATVLHLHQGTPYVYQGEELGMTNTAYTEIGHYRDLESLNYYRNGLGLGLPEEQLLRALAARSRDNARAPMHWDDTAQAGFTEGTPWIDVNPNHTLINAAAAEADPDSVFHHYRRLIKLRHAEPVIVHGRFELLLPDHDQLWVFTRSLDHDRLLVLANCSSAPALLPAGELPELAGATTLISTHGEPSGGELRPWESTVLRLRT